MQGRLDERSYEVETPQYGVRGNRVHLGKTNEPSTPSSDQAPAEVFVPVCPQSNELPTTVPQSGPLPEMVYDDVMRNGNMATKARNTIQSPFRALFGALI